MRARNILTLLVLFLTLALPPAVYAATEHGVRVVVLDAGHGGNDPGAVYGGVKEKDLTLKVVLRLGKKIEQGMPGVKVVYTRTTDKALAPTKIEDLQKRADIANKAEGDLFLSVHVNAARSTSAKGVETLIMGETPKEQQYNTNALFESNRDDLLDMSNEKEAAIIRAYIQNLQFTYGEYSMTMARCVQQNYMQAGCYSRGVKQQPLRVLYATNMPGVLTEIGFLSNKEDFAFLKSDKGLTSIVNALYQAVQDYSAYVLKTRLAVDDMAEVKPTPAPKVVAKPEPKPEVKPQPEAKPEVKAPETPKADEPKLYDARLYGGQQPQRTAQKSAEAATQSKPSATSSVEKSSAQQPVVEATPQRYYTVQVMASKRVQPLTSQEFKSYRNRVGYQTRRDGRSCSNLPARAERIPHSEEFRGPHL